MEQIKPANNPEMVSLLGTLFGALIIFSVIVTGVYKYSRLKISFGRKDVLHLFIAYLVAYILISYIVTGLFAGIFLLNHHLYVLNLMVILWLMSKQFTPFFPDPVSEMNVNKWLIYLAGVIVIIILLALISVNSHGPMPGSHERFPL